MADSSPPSSSPPGEPRSPASSGPRDPFGWVGHTIEGKYRVDDVVARGGSAVVYRAHHLGLDQGVAIKCLREPAFVTEEERERSLAQFLAEGRLLHQLSRATADIVQALDVGVAASPSGEDTPYLVLEWLEGQSLEQYMSERAARGSARHSLSEAMAILEPAARALAAAHAQGVVHRDVKPGNLFLARVAGRTTLKVVDFGIAKELAGDRPSHRDLGPALEPNAQTTDSLGMFTPRYAAPEHFKKSYGATGPWTDVYGLALCLVELASGRKALDGQDASEIYLSTSDLASRPTLRGRGVDVSDAVEAVMQRALAVDPKRRYPDVAAFWDALAAANLELAPRPAEPEGALPAEATDRPARAWAPWPLSLAVSALALALAVAVARRPRGDGEVMPPPSLPLADGAVDEAERPPPPAPPGMLPVAPARFRMGDDEGKNERPAHFVTITRRFFLDRTEVTAGAFARCVDAGACTEPRVHLSEGDKGTRAGCNDAKQRPLHPVNCVDLAQAAAFCAWAGKRLPSEAEWELAARGADARAYPWGNTPPASCWTAIVRNMTGSCGKHLGTWEVGTTVAGAGPFGHLDLAGNVWEWVADGFDVYPDVDVVDPRVSATDRFRGVLRGGSWDYSVQSARTWVRFAYPKSSGHVSTGFRCAADG